MTHTGGTVLAWPEPPTVPKIEWSAVMPAALVTEMGPSGRRGMRNGEEIWPAAVLVNSGTYVGKARHAKPRESR